MALQSGGSISIGQARNECNNNGGAGLPNKVNAGNWWLSKLAGVGSGQRYAWSWWYNKSALPTLSNLHIMEQSAHVDMLLRVYVNLRTGAYGTSYVDGDNNPGVNWWYLYNVPINLITGYRYISCYVNREGGDTRTGLSIYAQPYAGNDWTCTVQYDDVVYSGATDVQIGLYVNAVG